MKIGTIQFLFCCDKKWARKYKATKRNIRASKATILTYNEETYNNFSPSYNLQCRNCRTMNRATITYEY